MTAAGVSRPPEMSAALSNDVCPHCGRKYPRKSDGPLTAQESRVLMALRGAGGATVPHDVLGKALETSSEFDVKNVLQVVVSRLRSKLKDARIVAIRGEGYALVEVPK